MQASFDSVAVKEAVNKLAPDAQVTRATTVIGWLRDSTAPPSDKRSSWVGTKGHRATLLEEKTSAEVVKHAVNIVKGTYHVKDGALRGCVAFLSALRALEALLRVAPTAARAQADEKTAFNQSLRVAMLARENRAREARGEPKIENDDYDAFPLQDRNAAAKWTTLAEFFEADANNVSDGIRHVVESTLCCLWSDVNDDTSTRCEAWQQLKELPRVPGTTILSEKRERERVLRALDVQDDEDDSEWLRNAVART